MILIKFVISGRDVTKFFCIEFDDLLFKDNIMFVHCKQSELVALIR